MDIVYHSLLTILVSFVITFIMAKIIIPLLRKAKAGQHVRDDGPQSHLKKEGTPTMGGIIMLLGLIVASFIFAKYDSGVAIKTLLFLVITTAGFALIGFLDDALKLFKKRSLGLRAWQKIVLQLLVSALAATYAYLFLGLDSLVVPFTHYEWQLGAGMIPFTMFVIIAMVNSVNLTDGLDGLATSLTLSNAATFLILILVAAVPVLALQENASAIPNIAVFSASLVGVCVGFLCFNIHPAKVFMGDTGSFALGAAITAIAIALRLQLLLPIMGFMFVLSSVSVIIQVGSYKTRKKRVFKMAPLHHHFELKGAPETKVVWGYLLVTILLCVVSIFAIVQ